MVRQLVIEANTLVQQAPHLQVRLDKDVEKLKVSCCPSTSDNICTRSIILLSGFCEGQMLPLIYQSKQHCYLLKPVARCLTSASVFPAVFQRHFAFLSNLLPP